MKFAPNIRALALLLACLSLSACSTASRKSSLTPTGQGTPIAARPLTDREAIIRAHQISHVAYNLRFVLDRQRKTFQGKASIRFDLVPKAKNFSNELFVDFYAAHIQSISLNGKPLPHPGAHYDGNRIRFKLDELKPGTNRVQIDYTHRYSANGHGLYRFRDPADGTLYLYTDDEPFFAHQFFPCFDQPDLKAKFTLTVSAPLRWQVVTNTLERWKRVEGGKEIWSFPATSPLSTYLFALIAGDYTSWKANANGIPMRLFARKSLRKYVDPSEWFDITRRGLKFYSTQFGYPYPFSKYDQILVPDFDEGAMENAGAVTFTEDLVFRTKVPQREHMNRANVILHEMAHQWFGDLVTMKWWDGLWLNESFAEFMAAWAVNNATHYKGSWQNFLSDDESWAYWQDQLATTHPIELPVPDTDHAFSNFDGITYGKGASVLKQLRFYLGKKSFLRGIHRYFETYAHGNTTLADFIRMLSMASGKNLQNWEKLWLRTQGVNTVRSDWACTGRRISDFNLVQGNAPESKFLRPHKTKIGLFFERHGKLTAEKKDTLITEYSAKKTPVPAATGKACPVFVYPNLDDEDYVKVQLDPVSQRRMRENLDRIRSPLVRQMTWMALWNSVVDGRLPATGYLKTAIRFLHQERNLNVIPQVLYSLTGLNTGHDSALKYISPQSREKLWDGLEATSWRSLRSAPAGSDLQLVWLRGFLENVHSTAGIQHVRKLLNGTLRLPGLKVDQDVRWSFVTALARNGVKDAKNLIAAQYRADKTHFGKTHELSALAQIPTLQNKMHWMTQIELAAKSGGHTSALSSSDLGTVMRNLPILGQEELTEKWMKRYFALLPAAARSTDEEFSDNYTQSLYPSVCSQALVNLTSKALTLNLRPAEMKNLKTHLQEEERCIRARAVSKKKPGH